METKQIIKELEEEIKLLDYRIIKIRNIISGLEGLDRSVIAKEKKTEKKYIPNSHDSWKGEKRKRKHLCEECHENIWSAWWNGKQLCKRCFTLKKKSPRAVERMERKNPEVFDEADLNIEDSNLED